MKTKLFISLFLIGFVQIQAVEINYGQDLYPSALYGEWRITKYTRLPGSDLPQDDITQNISRHVLLRKGSIQVDSMIVHDPIYRVLQENTADFLKLEYHTTPQKLGITDKSITVVVVTTGAKSEYPNVTVNFLVINKDEIIVPFEGVFFYLQRV